MNKRENIGKEGKWAKEEGKKACSIEIKKYDTANKEKEKKIKTMGEEKLGQRNIKRGMMIKDYKGEDDFV